VDPVLLDCDTHFSDHEPQLWAGLAAEMGLPAVPAIVGEAGQARLSIGGQLFPKPRGKGQGNPAGLGHLIGEGHDGDRGKFMAENAIAAAVLQPGFVGLSLQAVADRGLRTALADAYNVLAARACAQSVVSLRWAILLSVEDPDWSLAAVGNYRRDPNAVGAVVRPTARTGEARLSAAPLRPVLELLADSGLALFVHGGTGCYQWSPLADAYEDYAMTHAFGHMGEHMIALADLLAGRDGLPEGFRAVLLESGTSWIPSFLDRLDTHVRRLAGAAMTPSERFTAHFAVVPDPGERYAPWACRQLGAANVLFGSDYPHWDTVRTGDWMKAFGDMCPAAGLLASTRHFVPRLRG
jgi:uncharacterized protein